MKRVLLGVLVLSALGCAPRRVSVPIMPPFIPAPRAVVIWGESFDRLDPERWREVNVKRQTTDYQIAELDGRSCLKAESRDGASILVTKLQVDPDTYEWLSWEWRVDRLLEGEALRRKDGSDAAARMYVYFKTPGLPWQQRNLDYVWSAALPEGTMLGSAYSSQSKIIVVESGSQHVGKWRRAERNIEEDYRQAFGEDPPEVVALGLMTDTDDTGGHAVAYFDELQVSRQPRQRR